MFDEYEAGCMAPDWEVDRDMPDYMAYWREPDLVELQQRRRECFIRLLKATCRMPNSYAPNAFRQLTAYLDFTKAQSDPDELFELARKALSTPYINFNYYSSAQSGESIGALEYYVMTLEERDDWADGDTFAEEFSSVTAGAMLKRLQALRMETDPQRYLEQVKEGLADRNVSSSWFELVCRLHVLHERPEI